MKSRWFTFLLLFIAFSASLLLAQEKPKIPEKVIQATPYNYDEVIVDKLKLAREEGNKVTENELLQQLFNFPLEEINYGKVAPSFIITSGTEPKNPAWDIDVPVMNTTNHEKSPSIESMAGVTFTPDIMVAAEYWSGTSFPEQIRIRRSSDHGASFPTANVTIGSPDPLSLPKIRQVTSNEIGVVFMSQFSSSDNDIYFARVNKDLSSPTIVIVEASTDDQRRPYITSDYNWNTGSPYIYIVYYEVNGTTAKLMFKLSIDGGQTWSSAIEIDNFTAPYNFYCSVTFGSGSKLVATYTTRGSSSDDIKVSYSANFGSTWSTPTSIATSAQDELYPEVSVSNGNVWLAFYEYHFSSSDIDVAYSYTTNGGISWNGPFFLAWSTSNERFPTVRSFIGPGTDIYAGFVDLGTNKVNIYKASNLSPTSWSLINSPNSGIYNVSNDDPIALLPKYKPTGGAGVGVAWAEMHGSNYDIYFDADWLTGKIIDLMVTPSNRDVPYTSGSTTFTITSTNVNWDASDNVSWITNLNPTSGGNGTTTLTATYTENTGGRREGTITVTGGGITRTVTVTQAPFSHFTPVWSGNPYQAMNIYVTSALLEGIDLQAGDEIGVFDGEYCVGVGVLTEPITAGNPLAIIASTDDPTTPETDGFTPGNTIEYKYWDSSDQSEINNVTASYTTEDVTFSSQGTAVVDLVGVTTITQCIELFNTWNIFSLMIIPPDTDMLSLLDLLITSGVLVKVQDEAGNAVEELPPPNGWVNYIGNWKKTEGYYARLNADFTWCVTGPPVPLPIDIPLTDSWNIISYPAPTPQDAMVVLQPLIDANQLIKVQDEAGKAVEELPPPNGWVNYIGNFQAGEGYYTRTNAITTLTIDEPVVLAKGNNPIKENQTKALEYYELSYQGNPYQPMNIYVDISSIEIKAGSEIGIYDGELCVGAVAVEGENKEEFVSLVVSMDDPLTEKIDGFTEGNQISMMLWNGEKEERVTTEVITENGSNRFIPRGTMLAKAEIVGDVNHKIPTEYVLENNYPNPFNPSTTIRYGLPVNSKVVLEIYNIVGQKIETLVNEEQETGYYEVIFTKNDLASGVYLYRIVANEFSMTRKFILLK